jgi:amino acid adenylation domain-containing protein
MKRNRDTGDGPRVSLLLQTSGLATASDLRERAVACAARLFPGAVVETLAFAPQDAACAEAARRHGDLWIGLSPDMLALSARSTAADLHSLRLIARDILGGSSVALARPFAGLAEWFKAFDADEIREGDAARWWLERLHAPVRLPLATSPSGTAAARRSRQRLSDSLAGDIAATATSLRVAPASLWLASWWLLMRAIADEALSIWVLFDGRSYEGLADVAGPLARRAPLAWPLAPGMPFETLARQVEADRRRGGLLPEHFDPARRESGGVGFAYWPAAASPAPGWRVVDSGLHDETLALSLDVQESAAGMELELSAPRAGADDAALAHLRGLLVTLVRRACEKPQASLGDLLSACAPAVIPAGASPSHAPNLLDAVAAQAQRTPQAPAVVDGADSLTYAELWRRAGDLAAQLAAHGAGPECVVGLLAGRTVWAAAGLLAILRSGAAYLALDPAHPPERLKRLIARAGAVALITDANEAGRAAGLAPCPVVYCDRADAVAAPALLPAPDGCRCAYLMATSGSTGEPKLVAVEHRQLSAYAQAFAERAGLRDGLRYGMVTGWATDLGLTMVVAAWTRGGSLHLAPPGCVLNAAALTQFVRAQNIEALKITPSHLSALLGQSGGADLLPWRLLVLGGETSSWSLIDAVARARPGLRVMNHYGPTETTVGAIAGAIDPADAEHMDRPALGAPLASAEIHLLDDSMRPVPDWVPGEIYVGGAGVARGYAGAPAATARAFLPHADGGRLYATGDRARRLPDGRFVFLGRADFQVKINGYRVDPAETEVAICALPGVAQAAVVASAPCGQPPRLLAYVVARDDAAWDPPSWRRQLAATLPAHLVPASLTRVSAIPLRDNGKLDASKLPPEPSGAGVWLDRTQTRVAELWCEILGVSEVGPDDRFFDIGGQSLQVLLLHQRLCERLQVDLPLLQLFSHPTVRAIAALVDGRQHDDVVAASQKRADRQRAGLAATRNQVRRKS